MEYVAFALKYRPQNFAEVVGQEHVVTPLKNAILKNRVHHAYLFSGPRGIGKTSLARILAKALNCRQGPTADPCGKCPSCTEITRGKSLDIIEIDGASNRGIDEIRTLRESVKLSTAAARYKVYIIDEVHMLTQEAFNALLKTLEEPPAHVKFIFATTHPHKVIPTILSRCQKFQFNLVSLENIVGKLKKIVAVEKIKVQENLLYTIARAAGGSIRDAESLLDQLVPVVLEKTSPEDVFSFLGIIDEDSLNRALQFMVKKDLKAALSFVEKTVQAGKDLGVFLNALIEHLRNLLLAKISTENFKELSDVSPQSKDFISTLSQEVDTGDIFKMIDLLIVAKDLSHRLNTVRIPLELALIKYSHREPSAAAAPRPKAKNNPGPEKEAETLSTKEEIDDFDLEPEETPAEPESTKQPEPKAEESEDPPREDNVILPAVESKWKDILSQMHKKRAALSTHLSFGRPIASYGSLVVIGFSPRDSFHKESVDGAQKIKYMEESLSQSLGRDVRIKLVFKELPRAAVPEPVEGDVDEGEDAGKAADPDNTDDGFLNNLLDTFGGKFQSDES